MKCSCCGAQKHSLKERNSTLVGGMKFWSCDTCLSRKFEPRAYVILAGRSKGFEFVAEVVKNKRYVGQEITARDLIN